MPYRGSQSLVAVASGQGLTPEKIRTFITNGQLFPLGMEPAIEPVFGHSPEDFVRNSSVSMCFMPENPGEEWLGGMTRLSCRYFIECFEPFSLNDLSPLISPETEDNWDLLLCLSTRTAYNLPAVRKFVTALRHRGLITDTMAPSVELAVQEAFANALIHGNMGLATKGHISMDQFRNMEHLTQSRLKSDEFGGKSIILAAHKIGPGSIEIVINDQGSGFITSTEDSDFKHIPREESTFGRGLALIKSVCDDIRFERNGRTIKLNFSTESMPLQLGASEKIEIVTTDPFAAQLLPANATTFEANRANRYHSLKTVKILIADDALISRELIASYLRAEGFENLIFACDGEDTLAQVDAHHPDLIILDIVMPKLDGYEVCKKLRSDPVHADTPIIAQTALEENAGRTRIFQDGATDLIQKPLNRAELIARARIHLENRLLVQQLQAYRERIQAELDLARNMQEGLNPGADFYRNCGIDFNLRISATFQMSSELGGDMWGIIPLDDHRLAVYIVDFAGHGLGAALNTFRLHSLIWSDQQHRMDLSPGEYLSDMNKHLKGLLPIGQYATMLYGIIDKKEQTFSYATAACPSPVIGCNMTGKAKLLDGSGVPLGITRNASYTTSVIPFTDENFLLLYSDALIETKLENGDFLSEAQLLEMVENIIQKTGGDTDLAFLIADNFRDRAPSRLDDDFTVVSVQSLKPHPDAPTGNTEN